MSLTPTEPVAPAPVLEALAAAGHMREKLTQEDHAVDDARTAVAVSEETDRVAMAQDVRQGREPTSNTKAIAAARDQLGVAERRRDAHLIAYNEAQADVRAAVEAERQRWAQAVAGETDKARERARKALERLTGELGVIARCRSVDAWLNRGGGFDNAHPPTLGTALGVAPGSDRVTANRHPLDLGVLVGWLDAALTPPAPPAPVEPRPLAPVPSTGYRVSVPVAE